MKIPGNYPGRLGLDGLTITGLFFLGWLIRTFGPACGINTPKEQFFSFLLIVLIMIFVRFLPVFHRAVQERQYRRKAQQTQVLPVNEKRLAPRVALDVIVREIRDRLRHHYGCFWPRKIRILLVVGSVSDVQRLVPGLSQELWQEDRGTLLLWGGELMSEAEAAWLSALRKLRSRPADGIVWVTSAFDNEADADSAHHENKVTADAMESLAHAFYRLYDALGWRLPLYVWSLHGQNVDHAGYVTQPVGCLLPADCASEHLSAQLSSLSLPLMTQGVQHICEAPGHTFLLSLADRLLRKPETIAAPLAVFLNTWRPLPLAGVIFSMPSREAARTVRHHWSKDNRWDALPASVMALPAGLRPRKPGINRQQVAAVTGAVALALTGPACWFRLSEIIAL
ncbi:hypothetical protein ACSMAD_002961 [Cronobacter sakazakii]